MATARQALRRRRAELDLSQEAVALAVGISTTAYRAYEDGTATPRVGRRRRLAEVLEVTLTQVDAYLDGNGAPNGQNVPQWLTLYASLEQAAASLWTFQPFTVPALLQTPDYATGVERIAPAPVSEDGIARRVDIRIARQGVLSRQPEPLHLSVVLDESVLRRVAGDRDVMVGQLDHLAEMAERPNVELRVLPLDARVHTVGWGSFIVLATLEASAPQMVCVEDRTGIRYLEGPHAVDAHMEVYEHLCDYALPAPESAELIRTIVKETYQ